MDNKKYDQNSQAKSLQGRTMLIPLKAGCLTFSVALLAIMIGLWLDLRLGTTPRWMLILLIGSAPLALGGVYLIVRRSMNRMRVDVDAAEPDDEV